MRDNSGGGLVSTVCVMLHTSTVTHCTIFCHSLSPHCWRRREFVCSIPWGGVEMTSRLHPSTHQSTLFMKEQHEDKCECLDENDELARRYGVPFLPA
jgi:hypothetical protein